MVTGFFSKGSTFYTHYQERSRIIAVSSKLDDYYKANKKQLIFCVSDLYIKVWRMETKANRTEFAYAGKTPCSERIIQDAERNPGVKVFNMSVLDAKMTLTGLYLLVKLVFGTNDSAEVRENLLVYEWTFTDASIAAGKAFVDFLIWDSRTKN